MENVDLKTFRFAFALIGGVLSAYFARKGGRNPIVWFFIGSLVGFFGLLPIFFLPMKKQPRTRRAAAAVAKIMFIDGPANKFWYYLDTSQNQMGPMSLTALSAAWKAGKIAPTTYVWHEELPDWKPLQEFIRQS